MPDCGKRRKLNKKVAPGEKNRKARSGREWVNCDDRKEVREGRVLFILLEKMGFHPGQRHRHQELHGEALVDTSRPSQTGQNAKANIGVLLPALAWPAKTKDLPPVGSPEDDVPVLRHSPCPFLHYYSAVGVQ